MTTTLRGGNTPTPGWGDETDIGVRLLIMEIVMDLLFVPILGWLA
ncbi:MULTISPECIES: hypothetical protein [Rhodococcus]|nr:MULTISPECIES: hypothetical protein [Rhodococcus]